MLYCDISDLFLKVLRFHINFFLNLTRRRTSELKPGTDSTFNPRNCSIPQTRRWFHRDGHPPETVHLRRGSTAKKSGGLCLQAPA